MTEELSGLLTADTKAAPVPLTAVRVEGNISGRGAKVKIIQRFKNGEDKPIEAVYKFPLPEGGAFCGFMAIIGEKIIEGDIEEREKAFELYDEALSKGHGAMLLDEERPNIFTLSVGNLNPGDTAIIEIEYVTLLEAAGSEVRFFLPTTISPRYIPDGTPDNNGIPEDGLINPVYGSNPAYGLSLLLTIHGKEGIESIVSPSHTIRTNLSSDPVMIEFSSETVRMDRDFVLNIKYKKGFENRGYICRSNKGTFIQVDFCPGAEEFAATASNPASVMRKEVIFVLDCSGSMSGNSIAEAKKALDVFLKGLEEGMRFNIYRFGSSFKKLLDESVPYTEETLDMMVKRMGNIDADLGGTEMLAPLKDIYDSKVLSGYTREVILITDGQVGNDAAVTERISRGSNTRLFTVGIGYGPNEYFIKQMARTGGGKSVLIAPGERIEPRILSLFKSIMSGSITDLKIDWGTDAEQSPYSPIVFAGDMVSILARNADGTGLPEEVTISGKAGSTDKKFTLKMQEICGGNIPVHLLWARESIRDLEEGTTGISDRGSKQTQRKENRVKEKIIKISKEFGLISRETSFIAIEKREEKDKAIGEVVLRKVPVNFTKGWCGGGSMHFLSKLSGINLFMDKEPIFLRSVDSEYISQELSREGSLSKNVSIEPHKYTAKDILLMVLSLQRAAGGFMITKDVASILGIDFSDIKERSEIITVEETIDRFILLSTAIIMMLLKKKFDHMKDSWITVVQKSEKWLAREMERTKPHIKGVSLDEWADDYVANLKVVCLEDLESI